MLVSAAIILTGIAELKGKEIMAGFPGMLCSIQNQIPLILFGFNDSETEISLNNSNYCFSNQLKVNAFTSTNLFYHGRNKYTDLMSETGCDSWVTSFGATFLDDIIELEPAI